MDRTFTLLIDGEAVEGVTSFDVINPATEQPVARCPKADEALLERAVDAAKRAFPAWAATAIEQRAALVDQLADAIQGRAGEFAGLLTSEQGKPTDQAFYEVGGATYILKAFSQMRLDPRTLRDANGSTVIEHRVPLGVVAAITPWNFPLLLLMNKIGPALVAGNTIVAKPAPTTPLTTLLFGELCGEILPAGVVNIICDENELGPKLTAHPDIAKVAFTGSTETGRRVMASAAARIKRVTLELGGNDAAIVLDDVDAVQAARKIYGGAMANAGQICMAIKRVYVPEALFEPFCNELARLASEAVVGDGAKQGTQIGPIQNRAQFEKIKRLLESARQTGTVLSGGAALDRPGYFIPPTIVRDLDDDAPLVREEQFGPVLPVLKYADIEDVISRANDTETGLGGSVWSNDVSRATEIAKRIQSGTVWINQHQALEPGIPFRGAKQSGIGGELGEAGFHEYTQAQIINAVPFAAP